MDILNSRAPMNRPLAVIDGGLHSKTGVPKPPTAQKPKLLEQVRRNSDAPLQSENRGELRSLDPAVYILS